MRATTRTAAAMAGVLATMSIVLMGVATAQEGPKIEPRADQILRVMSNVLAQAEGFSVRNHESVDEFALAGGLIEVTSTVDLAVKRPDKVHALLHGEQNPMRYWIAGGKITVLDENRQTYATAKVPKKIDAAIDRMWDLYAIKIPLADFISADPYESLTRNVESGVYIDLHDVDGVPCHHLAFQQDDIDWQIWIEDSLMPVPRKLLVAYKNQPGAPRYTARLSDWNLSPGLVDSVFDFEPPEGAEQIEFAERDSQQGE